uniref:Putative endonuclease n=1 Tax=Desulfovibrio sp. U5L TaxID=596152 RepID=I2Q2Z2_9BACT
MTNYKRIKELFSKLGFCDFIDTFGGISIADSFGNKKRCGLYCLAFNDDTFYIGQAIDIPRRFIQHRKTYDDIKKFCFKVTNKEDLSTSEEFAIKFIEKHGVILRNIMHTSAFHGECDFDEIFDSNLQKKWLSEDFSDIETGARLGISENLFSRNQSKTKFLKLIKHPQYEDIVLIGSLYLKKCIPSPLLTEKSFWSVSCFPSTNEGDLKRIFCFNINMMETFVLLFDKRHPQSLYSLINISKEVLLKNYATISNFKKSFDSCYCYDSNYRAAGHDQITIEISGTASLLSLLNSSCFIQAAKVLNLRLMRKGINIYSKYHCLQLVDAMFRYL